MQAIRKALESPSQSLLCIGPLSANIIDAAISLSRSRHLPFVFIASRHQIDSKELGGGYVENWNTETFGKRCQPLSHDLFGLGRDHGGPGQGSQPLMSPEAAMAEAKRSFEVDIDSGFTFLHIDTSAAIGHEKPDESLAWKRLMELYSHVVLYSRARGKKVWIEVGTEEQSGEPPCPEKFRLLMDKLLFFTRENGYPMPLFVVLQTGTRVLGTANMGAFERDPGQREELREKIRACVKIAAAHGCFIKEHNADYLSRENLAERPSLGIKSVNVAPEFGVTETRALIRLLRETGMHKELEAFGELAIASEKWRKWLAPGQESNDQEKILLAGHYMFSHPQVAAIKAAMGSVLSGKGADLDKILRADIMANMAHYFNHLGFTQ